MEERVEPEAKNMPLFDDILDHKVFGREYKRGAEKGAKRDTSSLSAPC